MSEKLHLHSVTEEPAPEKAGPRADPVFMVIQRSNGSWSVGARIVGLGTDEEVAEAVAMQWKRNHPQQTFGVFMLRSEAREVKAPIEIVRVAD